MPYEEARRGEKKGAKVSYYEESLKESAKFREEYKKRKVVIKAGEMPWEDCPQGHIKHVVNQKMDTAECALDVYVQTLPPGGCSGKQRHMAEKVFFVLEGKGYDLHWDVNFELKDEYSWSWDETPKRFDWEEGDFVYIPPYTMHQHFNADSEKPARIIAATNRAVKFLGFDWLEQVEPAPDYKEKK